MMRGAITSAVLWTLLISGGFVLACGGQEDTRGNVSKALEEADLQGVSVEVDDEAKIVHLKGAVGTMSDRTRAEELAAAAVGTNGRVLNELTVDGLTTGTADSFDDDIEDALDTMIDNDAVLKERDVNFEVANGVVTVLGEVRTADEKNRVTRIVKAAPGVKDFANALNIEPKR